MITFIFTNKDNYHFKWCKLFVCFIHYGDFVSRDWPAARSHLLVNHQLIIIRYLPVIYLPFAFQQTLVRNHPNRVYVLVRTWKVHLPDLKVTEYKDKHKSILLNSWNKSPRFTVFHCLQNFRLKNNHQWLKQTNKTNNYRITASFTKCKMRILPMEWSQLFPSSSSVEEHDPLDVEDPESLVSDSSSSIIFLSQDFT